MNTDYDVIIIGAGPAGITAAIYADRAGLKTLLLEKMFVGGQIVNTYEVENYPGFDMILGTDLVAKLEGHVKSFPDIDFKREEVISLDIAGTIKTITTKKNAYTSPTLIIATGATPRYLGVEGEERLRGIGVSYCGTCDGAMYRGKEVLVVGGGNVAVEDAIFLSRLCKTVHLVHRRDAFRAEKRMVDNMLKIDNIVVHYDSVVEQISGERMTESVTIKHVKTQDTTHIPTDCIFIAVGQIPNNKLVEGLLTTDEGGYIITDDHMATHVPGVFAAGDGRVNVLKQIVTAAGEGAIAAYGASVYLANL